VLYVGFFDGLKCIPLAGSVRNKDSPTLPLGTPAKDVETLIKDLQSDSIPSETKVIIVDEAATSSSTSLHELAKAHSEFLNRTGRPVKMLFIYDPNQTSSSQKEQPDIEDIGYEVPSGYGAASTEVRQKM